MFPISPHFTPFYILFDICQVLRCTSSIELFPKYRDFSETPHLAVARTVLFYDFLVDVSFRRQCYEVFFMRAAKTPSVL